MKWILKYELPPFKQKGKSLHEKRQAYTSVMSDNWMWKEDNVIYQQEKVITAWEKYTNNNKTCSVQYNAIFLNYEWTKKRAAFIYTHYSDCIMKDNKFQDA